MSEIQSIVEYREIKGRPGYKVGSDGSVWSCRRVRGRGRGNGTVSYLSDTWKKLTLNCPSRSNNRIQVCLRPGKKLFLVNRLVLEAFVGPCPKGMEACHFPDRNPRNNCIGNLRWDTKKANQSHRIIHGTDCRGSKHPNALLDEDRVRRMREEYDAGGVTCTKIAAKYGVHKTTIARIVARAAWKHVA